MGSLFAKCFWITSFIRSNLHPGPPTPIRSGSIGNNDYKRFVIFITFKSTFLLLVELKTSILNFNTALNLFGNVFLIFIFTQWDIFLFIFN